MSKNKITEDKIDNNSYWHLKLGLESIHDGTDEEALYYLRQAPSKIFSMFDNEPIEKMPLHYAIQKGMLQTAKMLIEEKKANVNFHTEITYETPLILAIQNKQKEIADLLVKHGANIHAMDIYGNTPLALVTPNKQEIDDNDIHDKTAEDYGLSSLMTSDDNQADIVGKNSMIENSESF